METYRQSKKVGAAGSFINQMMGNNDTRPVVGDWFTLLKYSDRSVGKVIEVSEDGGTAVLEHYSTMADKSSGNLPHGHQCWIHEPTGQTFSIRWNANKFRWERSTTEIVFCTAFANRVTSNYVSIARYLREQMPEKFEEIYKDGIRPIVVVDGFTRESKTYSPLSIIFGVCDYHYDWSF